MDRTAAAMVMLGLGTVLTASCDDGPPAALPSAGPAAEATSLLGRPHYRPDLPLDAVVAADSALAQAPGDPDLILAAGAARASVWMFRDAIGLYTRGIELFPEDARFYRFRGHRYITVREFEAAAADLDRAAALDSTNFDVVYHQGLAHYLLGHFAAAAAAYGKCLGFADNETLRRLEAGGAFREGYRSCMRIATDDDARVAMTDWAWRAASRAGNAEAAAGLLGPIQADMAVNTNHSYHQNLLMYRGLLNAQGVMEAAGADSVRRSTSGYAVANWYLVQGDTARARTLLGEVADGPHWPGFGVIAAEADLARLR